MMFILFWLIFFILPVIVGMGIPWLISKIRNNIRYFLGYGFSIVLILIGIFRKNCNGLGCLSTGVTTFLYFLIGLISLFSFSSFIGGWKAVRLLLIIGFGTLLVVYFGLEIVS